MSLANQVFEPIEPIVHFKNFKINIIKFKWNGNIYKVSEMLQSWDIPSGENYSTHFIVICQEQDMMCELSMSLKDRKWKWELIQYESLA